MQQGSPEPQTRWDPSGFCGLTGVPNKTGSFDLLVLKASRVELRTLPDRKKAQSDTDWVMNDWNARRKIHHPTNCSPTGYVPSDGHADHASDRPVCRQS